VPATKGDAVSAWIGIIAGCGATAVGIGNLNRARAVPSPGARTKATGLLLIGVGLALHGLQLAAGWLGAVGGAVDTAGGVLVVLGLLSSCWGWRTARRARRTARGA
jgi:hypothetical protein